MAPPADDADLVTVAGLGMPGTTEVRRDWLESLTATTGTRPADTDPHPDEEVRAQAGPSARHEVATCHTATGALVSVTPAPDPPNQPGQPPRRPRARASKAYRPPAALIDLVKARDGRCRFPGCTVNARFCDLDHVTPWPLGPTRASNLMCLCRRHHRIKQTAPWRVRIDPDATVTWTDPTGRLRTTLPLDFLQLDARRDTTDADESAAVSGSSRDAGQEITRETPVDDPGVLWSVWEEELGYRLAVAERATRRYHPNAGRAGPSAGRLECTPGSERYALAGVFATSGGGHGRRGASPVDDGPPF